MAQILFKAIPYSKEDVTLALESGVDAVIVPAKEVSAFCSQVTEATGGKAKLIPGDAAEYADADGDLLLFEE